MQIKVIFEIKKENGDNYRVEKKGNYIEEGGTVTAEVGGEHGMSIKNSIPQAVLTALQHVTGSWVPASVVEEANFEKEYADILSAAEPGIELLKSAEFKRAVRDVLDEYIQEKMAVPPVLRAGLNETDLDTPVIKIEPTQSEEFRAVLTRGKLTATGYGNDRDEAIMSVLEDVLYGGLMHGFVSLTGMRVILENGQIVSPYETH